MADRAKLYDGDNCSTTSSSNSSIGFSKTTNKIPISQKFQNDIKSATSTINSSSKYSSIKSKFENLDSGVNSNNSSVKSMPTRLNSNSSPNSSSSRNSNSSPENVEIQNDFLDDLDNLPLPPPPPKPMLESAFLPVLKPKIAPKPVKLSNLRKSLQIGESVQANRNFLMLLLEQSLVVDLD